MSDSQPTTLNDGSLVTMLRIIRIMLQADIECHAPEGDPADADLLADYDWLYETAELNTGEDPFVFSVGPRGVDKAVQITFTVEVVDV